MATIPDGMLAAQLVEVLPQIYPHLSYHMN
jgi:hypothetical protein